MREKFGPSLNLGLPRVSLGFTMIELLIAIAIMAILATTGFTVYTTSLAKSRDAQRRGSLSQMTRALESYALDNGGYPGSCSGKIYGCGNVSCDWGGTFTNGSKVYMSVLPKDPVSSQYFVYAT